MTTELYRSTLDLPNPGLEWSHALLAVTGGVCIGLAVSVVPEGGRVGAIAAVVGVALIVLLGLWWQRRNELLISTLALSFIFSGLRQDIGLIYIEPWMIVVVICFLNWPMRLLQGERPSIHFDKVGFFALFVVVSAWLSVFGAVDLATGLKRAMKILLLFGVYLYLVHQLRHERQFLAFIRASFLACALTVGMLIIQRLRDLATGQTFEMMQWAGAPGTFANASEGATYIAIFLVIAVSLYSLRIHERVMSHRLFILFACLFVLGLILAMSRTGLLAAAGVTALLFVRNKRLRPVLVFGVVAVAAALTLPVTRFWFNRILGTLGLSGDPEFDLFIQAELVDRVYLWSVYWEVIKAYPVFGIGAANYGFFEKLRLDWPATPEGTMRDLTGIQFVASSHNGFLSWWVEAGTVGIVAFVGSLVCAAVMLRGLLRSRSLSAWQRALGLGTYGGLWVFVLTNLAGEFGVSELRYWMLLAFASVVLHQAKESGPLEANRRLRERRERERSEE